MLLIVVLVMVVVLTVGLSVATRSITNLRSTTEEENAQRAFSAAEAGVEIALKNGYSANDVIGSFTNSAKYDATVATAGAATQFPLNNGEAVGKDTSEDIWLSDYPAYDNPWTGTFTIYWGSASSNNCQTVEANNTMAALEIIVLSGSTTSPTVSHYAYDPCSQRQSNNQFSTPVFNPPPVNGVSYLYATNGIAVTNGLLARIIPVYASDKFYITANSKLPGQGTNITSTGTSNNSERKLTLYQGYPKVPTELFPFVIFSPK